VREAGCDVRLGLPWKREAWAAFIPALCQHMKARNLDKNMYWGLIWDPGLDPALQPLLAELAPGVAWTRGSHNQRLTKTERAITSVYNIMPNSEHKGMGWKAAGIDLVNPRDNNSVHIAQSISLPYSYRILADRVITAGVNGFGRIGADFWEAYLDGMNVAPESNTEPVGMPVLFTQWPGPQGAESSARHEALIEGVQEAEARIFIEQALERGTLPKALAEKAGAVLAENARETAFMPRAGEYSSMNLHQNWQTRTRKLFAMAAEVGAAK